MTVFVAGEGPDEIGDWAQDPAYLPAAPAGGIVEELLRKVRADGWQIVHGCPWKRIRKFKVGRGLHDSEVRNVLGVADMASEKGCDCVAFVRDRDREIEREDAIEAGIKQARDRGLAVRIIGGVAVETTDAWILALLGELRTEGLSDPKRRLREGHQVDDGVRKAQIVAGADLDAVPADARSVALWIERASTVLGGDFATE